MYCGAMKYNTNYNYNYKWLIQSHVNYYYYCCSNNKESPSPSPPWTHYHNWLPRNPRAKMFCNSSAPYESSEFRAPISAASASRSSSHNGSLSSASTTHPTMFMGVIAPGTVIAPAEWIERAENGIEQAIFDFRFLSLLAVAGSLAGSFLCFLKGCVFILDSYRAFYGMCLRGEQTGKMILRLVEAVDVYLTGTVMLIFGMGLYGLFISNIATNLPPNEDRALQNSSLFGMFFLQERPKWMRIASLDELKAKLGHVVVMILLVKMFERSKAITITTGVDLLSYSVSIFLTSAALLVLRHLHN